MKLRITKAMGIISLAAVLGVALSAPAFAQNWKDRAEYDLVQSINAERDAAKKLQLLDQWKEKYPESEFKYARLQSYLMTYQQAGNGAKMMETAKAMVALDAKNPAGYYWASLLTVSLNDKSADALANGEKAGSGLIEAIRAAAKPANVADADWEKQKRVFEAIGHKTLGWVAWQKKELDKAEEEFNNSLKDNPNQADVSSWLATSIIQQRKPEKQGLALFHIARSGALEGEGAFPEPQRKQALAYFEKNYKLLKGSDAGMAEVITVAKANALPPDGFKIKSKFEEEMEKEEELKKTNPQLALWLGIRKQLEAPDGDTYFSGTLKDSALPKLKAKVVSSKYVTPAGRQTKEVVVGIMDANIPEVTIKFDPPMAGKADAGTEIEFEGVPSAFSKEPFNLTIDVEKDKLYGWPAPAAPAPAPKKGGAKKK